MKLSGFRYLLRQGVDNVWVNRMMAFASFCVLSVSLLLVGISLLFYMNINSIIGSAEEKNEVIVYLEETTSDESIEEIGAQLRGMDNIAEVTFYSREEAYADLQSRMAEYSDLFASLGEDNPLIDAYRIRIQDISRTGDTVSQLEAMQHVEKVRAPIDYVNILTELRQILSTVAVFILLALVIVSTVIISNTTRASVFARRREISIMKYVGATNAFIRIPFFVEGMLTGILAGCAATAITWFSYDALLGLLTKESNLSDAIGLGSIIPYEDLALPVAIGYVGVGALIGAFGSVISTRKHLRV